MTDWTFTARASNGTYEVGCKTAVTIGSVTHTLTAGPAAIYPMLGGCTPAPRVVTKTMGATVSGTMQFTGGISGYTSPTELLVLVAAAGIAPYTNGCAFRFWIPVVMNAQPGDAPTYDGCAHALTVQKLLNAFAATWVDWLPYSCTKIYGTPPMLTVYRKELRAIIEKDTKLT